MENTMFFHPNDSHMAVSQDKQMLASRSVASSLGYIQLIDLKN